MASNSSTERDEEATTEEVPRSIVICKVEGLNTFNNDVQFSMLSLRHVISFSFVSKDVKGLNHFPSRANNLEICKKMLEINGM